MVLGHEAGGTVTALPEGYEGDLKVGDDVAVEAGVNCARCEFCKGGRYNLCTVSGCQGCGLMVSRANRTDG